MRIAIILIAAVSMAAGTLYIFRGDPVPEESRKVDPPGQDVSERDREDGVGLDAQADALERLRKANRKQLRQSRQQQALVGTMLADLESRLRAVEVQQEPLGDSREGERTAERRRPGVVGEADLGRWMDEALDVGWDPGLTQQIVGEAEGVIADMPGVEIEDMHCGARFCRAAFAGEDGAEPALGDLFGHPPFMNDGFTMLQPDGQVVLYFLRPGESLDALRSEVGALALESSE